MKTSHYLKIRKVRIILVWRLFDRTICSIFQLSGATEYNISCRMAEVLLYTSIFLLSRTKIGKLRETYISSTNYTSLGTNVDWF